jgi:uncharacterized protein HemY
MSDFAQRVRRAKEHLDNANAAASRGDWLSAERELRETQLDAREMRLLSLGMRLEAAQ